MTTPPIVLIGDSITEGFDTSRYFLEGNISNRGVSGDSTEECLERISEEWFREHPSAVFLCIGTNDLARERSDRFILENIRTIVEKIRRFSRAPIYLTTLFPTRENPPRPNERIRGFNRELEKLAAESDCRFYDLHRHFTDEEGSLRAEFTDDGLHLTAAAYRRWSELLSDTLREK
jgi:lysophospholipase L1-like esterase